MKRLCTFMFMLANYSIVWTLKDGLRLEPKKSRFSVEPLTGVWKYL